ncbi:hypothetical protein [uncultured Pedobacter sp.]|uniref:hypothetical protein n=1 Tax=uncultured Pedobacter sp. TaxID=246139 RepID=UPI0025D8BACB|nr:hypothetical protein [uncultured Pedobacter sp.]
MIKSKRAILEEKNRHFSYVGHATNNEIIWGQYERMVDFIFETYSNTTRRYDEISHPLLHTISHGIELAMKENIKFFNQYSGIKISHEDQNALIKSHDLKVLAKEFKASYYRAHKKLHVKQDQKEEFNKYFKELEKLLEILNRSAETFRYAYKIGKKGEIIKPSIEHTKTVDFIELKKLYEDVKLLFVGAPNSIGKYTDFVDYQQAHPEFKRGKGYLFCQRLSYSEWYFDDLQRMVVEEWGWTKIRDHVYFDPENKENYEFTHWNHDIYIIAIDPSKK